MTTPNDRTRQRRHLSPAQLERNRKGGLAIAAVTDMVALGKRGGRPDFHESVRRAFSREAKSKPPGIPARSQTRWWG